MVNTNRTVRTAPVQEYLVARACESEFAADCVNVELCFIDFDAVKSKV